MTINLEVTQNPDFSALAEIHAACFPNRWSAADIAQMMQVKGTYLITGEGAFALLRCIAGEAEILTLAVRPENQRRGIARAMLEYVRFLALEVNAEAVFIEVRESNMAAINLYEKSGFITIARRKNYYTAQDGTQESAIVMRRTLG